LLAFLALALCAKAAWAGSVGIDGTIGVAAGYNSNPLTLPEGGKGAESIGLVVDAPLTYTGDVNKFSLRPQARFAETSGDVAVLSDYQYLTANWDYGGERNTLNARGDWRRDSTLYNQIEASAVPGYNLHRSEDVGSLSWQHSFTPRNDLVLAASIDRVSYEAQVVPTLSSFTYGQATAEFDHDVSPLLRLSLTGGFGRYELLDHSYRTDSTFTELGFSNILSEHWSWSAQVGYAWLKVTQTIPQYFIEQLPDGTFVIVVRDVDFHSAPSTQNYAVSLQRHFERLKLALSVTRALQPSGLGSLLTQDDVDLRVSGDWTERLNLSLALHATTLADAAQHVTSPGGPFYYVDLDAVWHLTELWQLEAKATYYRQKNPGQTQFAEGVSTYLTFARQLSRKRLK
jgi:hypothetical protein